MAQNKKQKASGGKRGRAGQTEDESMALMSELLNAVNIIPTLFKCEKCGLIISIDEEGKNNTSHLTCCRIPMVEMNTMVGALFYCGTCRLKVIVEYDCRCQEPCDLICCNRPMIPVEE